MEVWNASCLSTAGRSDLSAASRLPVRRLSGLSNPMFQQSALHRYRDSHRYGCDCHTSYDVDRVMDMRQHPAGSDSEG